MDVFNLVCAGHVGKIAGLKKDKFGRDVFRFSLACNFKRGNEESTLWLQCNILDPLLNTVLERGISTGEMILVQCPYADIQAAIDGKIAKSWLNVTCDRLQFLTQVRSPALTSYGTEYPAVIQFNDLMKVG